MSATLAAYNAVLRRVDTGKLVMQYFTDDVFLKEIEATKKYNHGEVIRVPLHTSRSGGYTAGPEGKITLNDAGNQGTDKAEYKKANHHFQVEISGDTIENTEGDANAVAQAAMTEIDGAAEDIRFQISRQMFQNGEGILARCGTTSNTNVVSLTTTASVQWTDGPNAVEREWVYVGLPVDIGTASSEASLVDGEVITAVDETLSAPTITVSTSITTTTSNYVSIKDARSGATSYEGNGLRNIVDDSSDLGGLTVAGQPRWKAAYEGTTATALTMATLLNMDRKIHQKTGRKGDFVTCGLEQEQKFYEMLQQQVRYSSDKEIEAGNQEKPRWRGKDVIGHPNCHNEDFYMGIKKHLFMAYGRGPHWQNEISGGSKIWDWLQGTNAFGGMLTYRCNLCTDRRNAFAAEKNLS